MSKNFYSLDEITRCLFSLGVQYELPYLELVITRDSAAVIHGLKDSCSGIDIELPCKFRRVYTQRCQEIGVDVVRSPCRGFYTYKFPNVDIRFITEFTAEDVTEYRNGISVLTLEGLYGSTLFTSSRLAYVPKHQLKQTIARAYRAQKELNRSCLNVTSATKK